MADTATTPRRIIQPQAWKDLVDLDEAQAITGLTRKELLAAVDARDVCLAAMLTTPGTRRDVLRRHIPHPTSRDPYQWRRGELILWTLRLGTYPGLFHGVEVIGYTGLAAMFDIEEQTVRAIVADPDEQAPDPVFEVERLALFDKPAMRAWGVKAMCLAPDGTPTRRRPRRN